MSDGAASYDLACAIQHHRRPDLEAEYKRKWLAENPGAQPTDLVVCIYDLPPVETVSIILRPPKDEAEAAQLKVAELINEALRS